MRIEFDSNTSTALDALAVQAAMNIYLQNAKLIQGNTDGVIQPQPPTPTPQPERTAAEAFGEPEPASAEPQPTDENDEGDDNTPQPAGALDSRGFPWDERIHSKTGSGGGALNKDGTWRGKRGVSNDLVKTVETELRAAGYGQASIGEALPATPEAYAAAAAPPPPTVVPAQVVPPVVAPPVVAPPVVPQPPAPPVVTPSPAPVPAGDFQSFWSELQTLGKTDPTVMQRAVAAAAKHGATLAGLNTSPHLIPAVRAELAMG